MNTASRRSNLQVLGEVAEVFLGKTPRKSEYADEGTFKVLKYRDLRDGSIDWGNASKGFLRDGEDTHLLTEVRTGDVLVGASAHSSEHVGRKVAIVRELPKAFARVFFVGELMCIRSSAKLRPEFVRSFLQSREGYEAIQRRVRGGHLLASAARTIEVPVPPRRDQDEAVAEIEKQFTRLDAGVEALRLLKAHLRRYRASILHAACNGHLSGFEGESYPQMEIGSIGEVVTGTTPPTSDPSNYGGDVPFFKPTDLEAGYAVRQARQYLSTRGVSRSRELPANTVLVTCIGATIGKTGLARVRCATNQQINAVIPGDDVLPEWLYLALVGPTAQRDIVGNASSTTLPILNKSRFKALKIPVPPIAVQRRLVSEIETRFSIVDAVDAIIRASAVRADRLRTAILRSAFDGRLAGSEMPSPVRTTNVA